MKKTLIILLTAILAFSLFISCEGDLDSELEAKITVTFDGNGSTDGEMAALKVKKGEDFKLTKNAFEKTDYIFTGWNTKADGSGYGYDDEEFVDFEEDTTLYAQWGDVGVTVTFNANDGSGSMDPVKVSAGVYELPENGFTAPEGYAFVRWSKTSEGEVEYEVGDELEVTEDVTLYAIWAQVLSTTPGDWLNGRYTITANTDIDNRFGASGTLKLYLLDGKTLNAKKGITVTDGNTLVIDKVGTNGNGKLIAGGTEAPIYEAGIGGGDHGNGGTVTINGGTVTATGRSYASGIGGGNRGNGGTVTINGGTVIANGGDNAAGIGGGVLGAGGKVTINGGIVTATGGMLAAGIGGGSDSSSHGTLAIGEGIGLFGGENKDSAVFISGPTESYTGDRYNYMKTDATTLNLTVTFNANGGGGSMAAQSVPSGVSAKLTANTFTSPEADKIFAGWTTGSDGSGTYYGDKETVTLTENLVLYAQWAVDLATTTLSKFSWTNGNVYSMSDDVTISDRITVTGSVTLILPKDKTLTASCGITVTGTNSLTINGKGSLSAGSFGGSWPTPISFAGIGGEDGGIGGEDGGIGGTVIINGGTVTATGGASGGAGIGGGNHGAGGTVTINGGTVTAAGGAGAAGIGAGQGSSNHGDLEIGAGVSVTVSDDYSNWSPYNGSRTRYMKANK